MRLSGEAVETIPLKRNPASSRSSAYSFPVRSRPPKLTSVTKSRTFSLRPARFPDRDSPRPAKRREPTGGEEWPQSVCSRKPNSTRSASPAPLVSSPRSTRSTTRAPRPSSATSIPPTASSKIYHAWVGTIFEFLFERHGHDAVTQAVPLGGGLAAASAMKLDAEAMSLEHERNLLVARPCWRRYSLGRKENVPVEHNAHRGADRLRPSSAMLLL
jgi:hypothetical protein